ncbi:MAG: STAS domain-containing protein [Phycisphaerales bacterium]|jgi:anti-anti-sigma factor|nr:STAS domain-containing protein [Phycisphaerales bacterium]
MNILSEQHLAATVLKLEGELTADGSDNFRRNIFEATQSFSSDIVVDCTALKQIDSVGLESLLWLSDEAKNNGVRLRLACVPSSVENIFRLTRLDGAFSSHPSVELAAKSLK